MTTYRYSWQRIAVIALVICAWAPVKLAWEATLQRQQNQLRYGGVVLTRTLRDQLTQGLTIGILAGLRNIVADFVWLDVTAAWEKFEWFKMDSLINLCTSLTPRSTEYWDFGGWQLAWNVSVFVKDDVIHQPNATRRMEDSRFWIYMGLKVYKRGIENNPNSYKLWLATGELYQNRLGDYRNAAIAYKRASELPDAPTYLERLPGYMLYKAGDYQGALDTWKALWNRLTPAQREEKQHWKEKIRSEVWRTKLNCTSRGKKVSFPSRSRFLA